MRGACSTTATTGSRGACGIGAVFMVAVIALVAVSALVGTAYAADPAPQPRADAAAPAGAQSWLSAEDLRLGDFKAPPPPYPFPLLGDERAREIYVDREGKLYKERRYSGMIPDWAQRGALRRGRCQVTQQALSWVGFQNNYDSSRVFIAVEGEACGYVYRPDDLHVVIDLPAVRVSNPNLLRDILTGAFPTPVKLVHVEQLEERGTRVTIALREPRRYLSAHVGRYVFVDIAR
ncbi:MAG: hypothetical protein RIT45_3434 [Pseudomonadota bacterium]